MREEFRLRMALVAGGVGLFALLILARLFYIQNSAEAEAFRIQADVNEYQITYLYPPRGEIRDRQGHLLAGNELVYEVGVALEAVNDPKTLAAALSGALGLDYEQVYAHLLHPAPGEKYWMVRDFVSRDQVQTLRQMQEQLEASGKPLPSLRGLVFREHLMRSYPEKSLASNVLGFVNRENRGYFGIEEKYNDLLAGRPIAVKVPTNPLQAMETPRVPQGTSLILSLDRTLQAKMEALADQALQEYGAKRVVIVVMQPRSGEILAMATTLRMDLNQFWKYAEIYPKAVDFNPAISYAYEPGSVVKIFPMAAALEVGLVTPDTPFWDTGSILVGGRYIYNWNGAAWGRQDMVGCLQHSLNVCLAWVALQLGAPRFYEFMDRFGFGHPTGIDLAAEAAGRLKKPGDADWYPVDLGTNAFGQGIAVTPIQVLMAASAFANEGRMVIPHVVSAIERDGSRYTLPPQYAARTISPKTAHTLSAMLAAALEGEDSAAKVPGYRLAGKTGTAQIPTPLGYSEARTNASFIGWGPLDDPQFMIYVWLEEPSTSIWASETAAPLFARAAEQVILHLKIPPDAVRMAKEH